MKMKKMFGTLTAKFAALAVAVGLSNGAWGDVTNTVASANQFGALALTGAAKTAYVAVPFGAFGEGDAQIAAADVVQAAALSDGDKMYVYNREDGKYDVYTVSEGAWTKAKKVTISATGTPTEDDSAEPGARAVATGTGVFIERADTAKPIYVYGQVLTNATASTTFGAGLTLVSPPSTNAMAAVSLNALGWSGVTPLPTKTAREKTYPDLSKLGEADYIYYRTAEDRTVRFCYSGGKWVVTEGDAAATATIPAGTAFWYNAKAAGVTVTW